MGNASSPTRSTTRGGMVALVSTDVTSPQSMVASTGRRRWGRGGAGRCAASVDPGDLGVTARLEPVEVLRQVRRSLQRARLAAGPVGIGLGPPSSARNERCAPLRRSASVTRRLTSAPRVSSRPARGRPPAAGPRRAGRASRPGRRAARRAGRRPRPASRADRRRVVEERAGRGHERAEPAGGDLDPEARRHDLFELVGLVEDHDVVLGSTTPPLARCAP